MTGVWTRVEVLVDADVEVVWDVVREVESWPRWTTSMTRVEPLGEPRIAVGHRYRVAQPGLPALVWSVTDVVPLRRWTWEQSAVGGTTTAVHELFERRGGGTRLVLAVRHAGPLRSAIGWLTAGRTRRFMELEADAIRSVSEQRQRERLTPSDGADPRRLGSS